jgi:hypothetical protein
MNRAKRFPDGPDDGLRSLEELEQPDVRMAHFAVRDDGGSRPITQRDRYESISSLELDEAVPSEVRVHFDTARNVYLYAWFVYRFHVIAEQQALATLELALRTKLMSIGVLDAEGKYKKTLLPKIAGGPLKEKWERAMLSRLLNIAAELDLLRNDRIEARAEWALRLARQRHSIEQVHKMTELGLTKMVLSNEDPVPTADELSFDWISHFAETLPETRNTYAHGSSMLHASVLRTFEIVRELVNQLYRIRPQPLVPSAPC